MFATRIATHHTASLCRNAIAHIAPLRAEVNPLLRSRLTRSLMPALQALNVMASPRFQAGDSPLSNATVLLPQVLTNCPAAVFCDAIPLMPGIATP